MAYPTTVKGLCKLLLGVPTAFCRAGVTGDLELNPNQTKIAGLGDNHDVIKGTQDAVLTIKCYGVAVTDLALWFPSTSTLTVGSFPDFLVELVGGEKYTMTACQPGAAELVMGEGGNEIVYFNLTVKGIATEAASSSLTSIYTSLSAFTKQACLVQLGAATMGTSAFSIRNGQEANSKTFCDGGATAGHYTEPDEYRITMSDDGPRFAATFETNLINWYNVDVNTNINILVTLNNGLDGAFTVTMNNFVIADALKIALEGGHKVQTFPYVFGPDSGGNFGRVLLDAVGGGS